MGGRAERPGRTALGDNDDGDHDDEGNKDGASKDYTAQRFNDPGTPSPDELVISHIMQRIGEEVVDYGFLRSAEGNVIIEVVRDATSGYIFAHDVRRQGLAYCHRAGVMMEDVARLGHEFVVIVSGIGLALRSLPEPGERRRCERTTLDPAGVGQSQSKGTAERAVQAMSEQVGAMRHWLWSRLGVGMPSRQLVFSRLVEHAAELISSFQVGVGGRTAFESVRGKAFSRKCGRARGGGPRQVGQARPDLEARAAMGRGELRPQLEDRRVPHGNS